MSAPERGLTTSTALRCAALAVGAAASAPGLAQVALADALESENAPFAVQTFATRDHGCGLPQSSAARPPAAACITGSASRGARVTLRSGSGMAMVESYATIARGLTAPFTAETLLDGGSGRRTLATTVASAGLKASLFDGRLTLTNELGWSTTDLQPLRPHDLVGRDRRQDGVTRLHRIDAVPIDRPGLRWSLSALYSDTSNDFSVGRMAAFQTLASMPGRRASVTTALRAGPVRLNGSFDHLALPIGTTTSARAGISYEGITMRVSHRKSVTEPENSALVRSDTQRRTLFLDLDLESLRTGLLRPLDRLGPLLPQSVSLAVSGGTTSNRFDDRIDRYRRRSIDMDSTWSTALGETSFAYGDDRRIALGDGARSRRITTASLSHSLRRGRWQFGLDASLTDLRITGSSSLRDRSSSFGGSIAYSAPNAPSLRLQLGRDQGSAASGDGWYRSASAATFISGKIDLTDFLRHRFERDDLTLAIDYRHRFSKDSSRTTLDDEEFETLVDRDRRDGILLSFGMRL